MAVIGSLMRLSFGGPLFGSEQWACTLHVNGASMNGKSAASFRNLIEGWMVGDGNYISNAAKLSYIKFNAISPITGKYSSTTNADTFDINPQVAGTGTPAPGQTAVAVSMLTAISRGRGANGRIYMPAGGQWLTVGTTGHVASGFPLAAANNLAVLINGINALTLSRVVVFSKIGQLAMPVTAVRAGDVVDTQRRRRSSIKEVYVNSSTIITP